MNESSTHLEWYEETEAQEVSRIMRERDSFKSAFETQTNILQAEKARNEQLKHALEHCLKVFRSLADRGDYPRELLPNCPEYLGKQGLRFVIEALNKSEH